MPGLHLARGGLAWMTSTVYSAYTPAVFLQAVAICGALAFWLLLWLARPVARWVGRADTRWLSAGTLGLLVVVVLDSTGWGGLAVAAGIGLIPVMWGSRWMKCMGVLLLPIMLNMLGAGPAVAAWLGLV